MTTTLPVSIPPDAGESIESWLEHLADANGLTTAQLLAPPTAGGLAAATSRSRPHPPRRPRPRQRGPRYSATLASFDGTALDLSGLDSTDRHSCRQVAVRGWTPAHGTQICPTCTADAGTWKAAWRLLLVTACTDHGIVLIAECPSCERPFRDQRHSHLRRVGSGTVCGNPPSVKDPSNSANTPSLPCLPLQPRRPSWRPKHKTARTIEKPWAFSVELAARLLELDAVNWKTALPSQGL
jgi:hypothetical protein